MAIKKEHRDLLDNISDMRKSLKEKKSLEYMLKKEQDKLGRNIHDAEKKLESLKDYGILYCKRCNKLYEMSDTKVTERTGNITKDIDEERYEIIG